MTVLYKPRCVSPLYNLINISDLDHINMNTTIFPNRLCSAEERTINFDPFGNWAAEQWVHKRDLASYETFK